MERMFNLLASNIGGIYEAFPTIRVILLVIMLLCALFIIAVVMLQPGNSSGVSALGGTTETFLSKNKGKTTESKLKKLTVISLIIIGVLCVVYFILSILPIV